MVGGYTIPRQVFTDAHEQLLKVYLLRASSLYFGLTLIEIRKLAHDYAVKLDLSIPKSWSEHGSAGKDWMMYYLGRHRQLSLRSPEATSLSRVTSFNRHNLK